MKDMIVNASVIPLTVLNANMILRQKRRGNQILQTGGTFRDGELVK